MSDPREPVRKKEGKSPVEATNAKVVGDTNLEEGNEMKNLVQQTGRAENEGQTRLNGNERRWNVPPFPVLERIILDCLLGILGMSYLVAGYLLRISSKLTYYLSGENGSVLKYMGALNTVFVILIYLVLGGFFLLCTYSLYQEDPKGRPVILGLLGAEIFTRVAGLSLLYQLTQSFDGYSGSLVFLSLEIVVFVFLVHHFRVLKQHGPIKRPKKPKRRPGGPYLA